MESQDNGRMKEGRGADSSGGLESVRGEDKNQ